MEGRRDVNQWLSVVSVAVLFAEELLQAGCDDKGPSSPQKALEDDLVPGGSSYIALVAPYFIPAIKKCQGVTWGI